MTENQRNVFGFAGKNPLWTEILEALQQSQETLWMHAIGAQVKGEDRVHACGQADGVNMALSLLINLRSEARALNGLTAEEDLA
jgi:hypothetical protein